MCTLHVTTSWVNLDVIITKPEEGARNISWKSIITHNNFMKLPAFLEMMTQSRCLHWTPTSQLLQPGENWISVIKFNFRIIASVCFSFSSKHLISSSRQISLCVSLNDLCRNISNVVILWIWKLIFWAPPLCGLMGRLFLGDLLHKNLFWFQFPKSFKFK